jgi:hypothetical protein
MNKLYGWYSLKAYVSNEIEYIYLNQDNQETFCTISSDKRDCPYPIGSSYHKDAVFVGEVTHYVKYVEPDGTKK